MDIRGTLRAWADSTVEELAEPFTETTRQGFAPAMITVAHHVLPDGSQRINTSYYGGDVPPAEREEIMRALLTAALEQLLMGETRPAYTESRFEIDDPRGRGA